MRISDWSSDVCSSDLVTEIENRNGYLSLIKPFDDENVIAGQGTAALEFINEVKSFDMKIGRASCRERVSVRVDLGGRRIIKKKNKEELDVITDNNQTYHTIIGDQYITKR